MAVDESLYLTTHEAALAVVATAMKKARLRIDTLIVNSLMGGILFTAGGMLHVMIQSHMTGVYKTDPGVIQLLQGLIYPIGLFYVVIMGVDLFNSNILFFSVGAARRAVSVLDLLISWFVSWWFNLVGNIFVCYIICHFSSITSTEAMVKGSVQILMQKAQFSFVETLIKGMAGNFFVCLAIYLQLMAKPLHVKFLMMLLPVFTFVAMGFTHSVADMYMVIIGLINKPPISVGKVAWKILLPGALGNIIGGSFFGLVIPWYLHLVVVERDQRELNLPTYDVRDEQPELNQDSRVVRQRDPEKEEEVEEFPNDVNSQVDTELVGPLSDDKFSLNQPRGSSDVSWSADLEKSTSPQAIYEPSLQDGLSRIPTRSTGLSRFSSRSTKRRHRSPQNVFPVYGMGPPSERERSIASGRADRGEGDDVSVHTARTEFDDESAPAAEYIGAQLRRALTRRSTKSKPDLESQRRPSSASLPGIRRQSMVRASTTNGMPSQLRSFSFSKDQSSRRRNDLADFNNRMDKAGITARAAEASNEAAGITPYSMTQPRVSTKSVPVRMGSPVLEEDSGLERDSSSPGVSDQDGNSFNVTAYDPADDPTGKSESKGKRAA